MTDFPSQYTLTDITAKLQPVDVVSGLENKSIFL